MAGSQLGKPGELHLHGRPEDETRRTSRRTRKLEKLNSAFDKAEDELEDKIDTLKDAVSNWTESSSPRHQENLTGLDTLIETLENIIDQRLASCIETIEEIEKTVSDEARDHSEGIASAVREPRRTRATRSSRTA
jgi:ABC-type transporter Mla subunit MlaD